MSMYEELKVAWNELTPWEQVTLASACTFGVLAVYGAFLALLEKLVPGGAGAFTFGFVLFLFIVMFWILICVVNQPER